jgi:signal peptidase I
MNKVKMESLLPFIEEAFERNQKFKVPITGTSMNPLLYQGRDFVFIEKPKFPLEIGDIPLYRRDNGAFVLHRIVAKGVSGYTLTGDNQFILEEGITDSHIIGVVTSMCIDGKMIGVNDPEYIKHKEKYVKNIRTRYPVRRFRYWFYGVRHGK